jgi:TfoX/Sxy family transcriptional regulator of competence genes
MGLVTEEELRARINEVAEARRVHKSCKQNQKKGKRKRELMSQTTLVDRFTVAKMA